MSFFNSVGNFFKNIVKKVKSFIYSSDDITYFVNFNFGENESGNKESGIFGSLVSPKKINLTDAKILIKNALPSGYTASRFYEAQEKGKINKTILIIFRDGDSIFEVTLNV